MMIIRSISLSYHLSIQTVDGETATLHLSKVGHYQYIKSSIINPLVPYKCPYELLLQFWVVAWTPEGEKGQVRLFEVGLCEVFIQSECITYSRERSVRPLVRRQHRSNALLWTGAATF